MSALATGTSTQGRASGGGPSALSWDRAVWSRREFLVISLASFFRMVVVWCVDYEQCCCSYCYLAFQREICCGWIVLQYQCIVSLAGYVALQHPWSLRSHGFQLSLLLYSGRARWANAGECWEEGSASTRIFPKWEGWPLWNSRIAMIGVIEIGAGDGPDSWKSVKCPFGTYARPLDAECMTAKSSLRWHYFRPQNMQFEFKHACSSASQVRRRNDEVNWLTVARCSKMGW